VTVSAAITGGDLSRLTAAINDVSASTGISAEVDGTSIKLISERGDDIVIEGFTTTSATTTALVSTFGYDGTGAATESFNITSGGNDSTRIMGVVKLNSSDSFTSVASDGSIDTTGTQTSTLASVDSIDISSFIGAQSAIDIVDSAIGRIDSQRAQLGAIQNRLSSTISNLGSIIENVSAARSRIRDTDFAVETSNLAKNQVLQQAGLSVLAQANASSQSILSLLQG
jgi:flagellin